MARHAYDTDVTRKQFEQIRPLLGTARMTTKPRQLGLFGFQINSALIPGEHWRQTAAAAIW